MEIKVLVRNCPICNNAQGWVLFSAQFALWEGHPLKDTYDIAACTHCGFVFADTENRQEEYDRYYKELSKYEDYGTSTGGSGNAYDAMRLSRTAMDIASVITDKSARILDVGCANGGLLEKLYDSGYRNLVGIDPSPVCARNAAGHLGIKTYTAVLFAVPPDAGVFDLIILSHVMEHILNLHDAIRALSHLLTEKGRLYIEVPDASRYADYITAPFQEFNMEHINHFTTKDLENMCGQSGFSKENDGCKIIEISDGMLYPAIFGFYKKAVEVRPVESKDVERGVVKYIDSSAFLMEEINKKMLGIDAPSVVVWGCGALTSKLLRYSVLKDMNIIAFVDGNPILAGKTLNGKEICSPERLKDMDLTGDELIIVASTIYEDAIVRNIREKANMGNPTMGFKDCLLKTQETFSHEKD
jgi:2-polyprenyl-3-methyl-5-hydroxy-6-metoxy-1,4-benzoquinol methylase